MEIAVLHFTDLHFSEKNNFLDGKEEVIHNAIKLEVVGIERIFICITGDLIDKGRVEAFKIFNKFILKLKQLLEESVKVEIVMIPGNHDCNFSLNDTVRDILIENLSYDSIGERDNSVIDNILKVQDEFWLNYQFFNDVPGNKLFFQNEYLIDKFKIVFNSFNSAWMSKVKDSLNLFFPVKLIEDGLTLQKGDINIALIHHPIFWFRPDGINNNRKELANFIEENNSLILFGHEHEEDFRKSLEFWKGRHTVHFSGKVMQNEKNDSSGFSLVRINLESKYSIVQFFNWTNDIYIVENQRDFLLNGDIQATKRFKSNLEFLSSINKPKIPISLDTDFEISLADVFVFPDLERRDRKNSSKILEDLIDSEKLYSNINIKKCIVEGENQSGKLDIPEHIDPLIPEVFQNLKVPLMARFD